MSNKNVEPGGQMEKNFGSVSGNWASERRSIGRIVKDVAEALAWCAAAAVSVDLAREIAKGSDSSKVVETDGIPSARTFLDAR